MTIDVGWVAPIIVGVGVIGIGAVGFFGYMLAKAAGDTDDQDGRPRG
jgi:hypothetical protein